MHIPRTLIAIAAAFALIFAWGEPASAQDLPGARRVAVVVGSNAAPPGRRALRYAHQDARAVGAVLVEVGGFARADVDVLVEPSPDDVLATIARRMRELAAAPGETVFVFHYAGHADAQGLFPNGALLTYDALRAALSGPGATVRVGIVDACRGGGWTGTRGLTEAPPFEVSMPMDLANAGTVLIASSSGLEDAHESEVIEGGFFTHHWVAGLRGAGDQSGDGVVSLTEAFEYAKRLTVRDSAATGADPQHPSFRMNLSGRSDVPLTRVSAADASLVIEQTEGPTQLIHLDAGLLVLELPAGARTARLAMLPGRYLVRVRRARQTLITEVFLRPDGHMTVRESELVAVGSDTSIARGDTPRVSAPAPPPGTWDFRLALGIQYERETTYDSNGNPVESELAAGIGYDLELGHAIGERGFWQYPLVFGYRTGVPGRTAIVPFFGISEVGFNLLFEDLGLTGTVGLRTETPIGIASAFLTETWLAYSHAWFRTSFGTLHASLFDYATSIGLRYSIGNRVDVGLGLTVQGRAFVGLGITEPYRPTLTFGSIDRPGRSVPVLRFHLSRVFSVDAYAYFQRSMETKSWANTFLLGFNATWPGAVTRRQLRASAEAL